MSLGFLSTPDNSLRLSSLLTTPGCFSETLSQKKFKNVQFYLPPTTLSDKEPISAKDTPPLGALWLHCGLDYKLCLEP